MYNTVQDADSQMIHSFLICIKDPMLICSLTINGQNTIPSAHQNEHMGGDLLIQSGAMLAENLMLKE